MEEFNADLRRERAIEEILLSNALATTKVKQIQSLGVDEDEAEVLVSQYQAGQMAPVYYERLDFDNNDAADEPADDINSSL